MSLRALEVDPAWRAVVLLSAGRMNRRRQVNPTVEQWVAVHEKIMRFCLSESSFKIRLELGGIATELQDEHKGHDALRFQVGHICPGGAEAHVNLGYWLGGDEYDWSEAPQDFENQFDRAESIHSVVYCRGKKFIIAEAFQDTNHGHGIDADMINSLEPFMHTHTLLGVME